MGLVEMFFVVVSAEALPRRFCSDGALLLSLATRETHRTGKALLAGFRIERVRQNVVECAPVHVHLKARVGAILIDQWPGVKGLNRQLEQVGRLSHLAKDDHARLIRFLARIRYVAMRRPFGRLTAGQEDIGGIYPFFPDRAIVTAGANFLIGITLSIGTGRPIQSNE